MRTVSLLLKFSKKNMKFLLLNRIPLVLILILTGLLLFTYNIQSHSFTQKAIDSPDPDFNLKIHFQQEQFLEIQDINSITDEPYISEIFYYDDHPISLINNESSIGGINILEEMKIIGVSDNFYIKNNISISSIVSDNLGTLISSTYNLTWFQISYEKNDPYGTTRLSSEGTYELNITSFTSSSFHNLSILFSSFNLYPLKSTEYYIIVPFAQLQQFLIEKSSQIPLYSTYELSCYLYLSVDIKLQNMAELTYLVNTVQEIIEMFMNINYEDTSYEVVPLILLKITIYQEQLHKVLRTIIILIIPLLLLSIPSHYYMYIKAKQVWHQENVLLSLKGAKRNFFFSLMMLSQVGLGFFVTVVLGVFFSLLNMIISSSFPIIYFSMFSLLLIEDLSITTFWSSKLFEEKKTIIKLKTKRKTNIIFTSIQIAFRVSFSSSLIALCYFLSIEFKIIEISFIGYGIIIFEVVNLLRVGFSKLTALILEIISPFLLKKFGDIFLVFYRVIKFKTAKSFILIFIFGFYFIFFSGFYLSDIYMNVQSNQIDNEVGGNISLFNIQPYDYEIIINFDEVQAGIPIVEAEIQIRDTEEDTLHLFFLHSWKLNSFLNFDGINQNIKEKLTEMLSLFEENEDTIIISENLFKKYSLNESSPIIIRPYRIENELGDVFMEPTPTVVELNIIGTFSYLPFFSEYQENWAIVPIIGSYLVNTRFANMAMFNLKNESEVETFSLFLQDQFPYTSVYYETDVNLDENVIATIIKIELIITLLLGTTLLLNEYPKEYLKLINKLHSRGYQRKKGKQILYNYQISFNTVFIIVSLLLSILFVWTTSKVMSLNSFREYKLCLNWMNTLLPFLVIQITLMISFIYQMRRNRC